MDVLKFVKCERHLCVALALAAVYLIYWSAFAVNAYNRFFPLGTATGSYAFDMYYTLNYPSQVHGLEMLIFSNHISPDQLPVMFLFYLYQSSLTLTLFQTWVMVIIGLLIFFTTKEFLKNPTLALVMCFAFFINPGANGMLISGYNPETFILLFYILTFYAYMKGNRLLFYISLVALLGTQEAGPLLAMSLGVGLYLREYLHKEKKTMDLGRMQMATAIVLLSIVALVAYNLVYYSLTTSYYNANTNLPPSLIAGAYPFVPIYGVHTNYAYYRNGVDSNTLFKNLPLLFVFGIAIALLSFGIGALYDILSWLVLSSPWLFSVLFLNNGQFTNVLDHYYSLVLGGTFVASILGTGTFFAKCKKGDCTVKKAMLLSASVSVVLVLFIFSALYISAFYPNEFHEFFIFSPYPQQTANVTALQSVISRIPQNSSIIIQGFLLPQLMHREYVGDITAKPSFVPSYVLVDFNPWLSPVLSDVGAVAIVDSLNYTKTNYTLYVQNGTATLYRRIR